MMKNGLIMYLYMIIDKMWKIFRNPIVLLLWLVVSFCCVSANDLSLSAISTWRYFCPISVSVKASNITTWYGTCQYRVSYNPVTESVQWSCALNGTWNQVSQCGPEVANWVSVFYWIHSTATDWWFTEWKTCSTFTLKWISTGVSSSTLKFVNISWSENIIFNTIANTWLDDEINLTQKFDTLTAVYNKTIAYEPCPCSNDGKGPNWLLKNGRTSWRITWYESITGFINDRDESNSTNYWFSGNKNFIAANYVGVPNGISMDNQNWVNSGTIEVEIVHSANHIHPTQQTETFSLNNGLNIIKNELSDSWYKDTWNGNDRWYLINFVNGIEYDVERPVTITITAADNAFNMWNGSVCNVGSHPMQPTVSYTFNASENPEITILSPTWTRVSTTTNVRLRVSDDWAGVDTGTVKVTIPEIRSGTKWSAGATLLMTWYTYSGSDLEFTGCTWEPVKWWGYTCNILITPKWEFPSNTQITITWYVEDFVENSGTVEWHFTTQQSASYFGCWGPITIYYVSGALTESPVNVSVYFTWFMVALTWIVENNMWADWISYPRFEYVGDECDRDTWSWCAEVLMCTPLNIHPNLTWNIKVRSGSSEYTWSLDTTDLYITWLNWIYQSGVVIIGNE